MKRSGKREELSFLIGIGFRCLLNGEKSNQMAAGLRGFSLSEDQMGFYEQAFVKHSGCCLYLFELASG